MIRAFVDASLFDGTGAPVRKGATVVVDGARIVEVSEAREFGSEVEMIDLRGRLIMPGLIDCHQHFSPWNQWLITSQDESLMMQAAKTAFSLRGCLEAGVTSARDMGGMEAGFRDAVDQGFLPGPGLQASLVMLQPTNGLLDHLPGVGRAISPQGLFATAPGVPTPWCDGPTACRAKVREVLRYGADFVKVANSGAPARGLRADRPLFTFEELAAIVDEAHRAGVPVCCHAVFPPGIKGAIEAGVDVIEHGSFLDRELAAAMSERGIWLVPTISIYHWHAGKNPDAELREAVSAWLEAIHGMLELAVSEGVPIAMGTDAGYAVGVSGLEPALMVEYGLTPQQSLVAATSAAARCMGIEKRVGTIEPGKEADLLVVDGDPLVDPGVLGKRERIHLVMKAGSAEAGPLGRELTPEPAGPVRYWL